MPWCLNHMKIASLTGGDFFFLVCFHFLPLLHKTAAISHRQGLQLSWSIPSILRFHSRTLLNPDWAMREKIQSFLCFFLCRCTLTHKLEGQKFPWQSQVMTLIFFPCQSITSALLPHVSSTAAQNCWSHTNRTFRMWSTALIQPL